MAKVYIVGAGPGDRGLISIRGMEAIKKADLIVYDRLVDENILLYAKEGCQTIYVGKQASKHTMKQDQINELLVEFGKKNMDVVRLKGGDPYVFGRGTEEVKALSDSGLEFELIPGVTSAIGGLAYAGIPVTSRGISSSFHVITGNGKNSTDVDVDWDSLAGAKGSLVFLMGLANIETIVDKLVSGGKSKNTPAAFVTWATWSNQKTCVTDLGSAVTTAQKEAIEAPVLFVVGDVVKLRDNLSYIEDRPLHGVTIGLTRDAKQSLDWLPLVEDMGARGLVLPAISIKREDINIDESIFDKYDCISFTSPNGVRYFFEIIKEKRIDLRNLFKTKIACLNHGTSIALEGQGIYQDIVADEPSSRGLGRAIGKNPSIKNILLVGSNLSGQGLKETLDGYGIGLDRMVVYTNTKNTGEYEKIRRKICDNKIDYMIFASPSSAESIIDAIGSAEVLNDTKKIAIGQVTGQAMEKMGLGPDIVSDQPTIERILELISCDLKGDGL